MPALGFCTGVVGGIAVTRPMHRDPDSGRWGQRMGRTRLRNANLPVGGTVMIGLSLLLPGRVGVITRALGAGAVVGVLGWGIVDPLPPPTTS